MLSGDILSFWVGGREGPARLIDFKTFLSISSNTGGQGS